MNCLIILERITGMLAIRMRRERVMNGYNRIKYSPQSIILKSIRPHVLKVYSEKLNKLNALYLGCGNSVLALEMA